MTTRTQLAGLALATTLAAASASAQTLYLHYDFNAGAGTTVSNLGTQSSASSTLSLTGGSAAAKYSADGLGVSGQAGDYALDFSAAGNMGSAAGTNHPQAWYSSATSGNQPNLASFTLTGWFQTAGESPLGGGARLVDFGGGSFQIFASTDGNLTIQVAGATTTTTGEAFDATQQWVFFAITYDSTVSTATDRLKVYVGGTSGSISSVALTAGSHSGNAERSRLSVGNTGSATVRPFHGLMDDLRLYGETSGGAGALSIAELNAIRVSAIPEPSAFAAIAGLGALGLVASRRRRR